MGNKNISCCGYSNDNFNLQLTSNTKGSAILKKLQSRLHYFLKRIKICKFLETNKSKSMQILSKHGFEFLNANDSQEILSFNGFSENGFSLRFPFLDNSKLLVNKESNQIISESIKNHKNEIAEFLEKTSNRSFQNIVKLPVYKDIVTEDVYFSYLNLLDISNIGQYAIIKENGIKIELNITDPKSKTTRGIVIFPNGNIYVGNLLLEKILFNNTQKLKTYDFQNEANNNNYNNNYNQISEVYTNNNNANNSSFTGNNNNNNNNIDNKTKRQPAADKETNKEIPLNEDFAENSFIIDEKLTPVDCASKAYDPFVASELDKIEFLEMIVNAVPCGEGILIQKNQIVLSSSWENAFVQEAASVRIINEKFELEAKIKNSSLDFSSVVLFDYENHSKYEGELQTVNTSIFNNNNNCSNNIHENELNKKNNNHNYKNNFSFGQIIKQGKGKLYAFSGEVYEGAFKNDQYHGEGVLFEPKSAEGFSSGLDFLQSLKNRQTKTTTVNEDTCNNINKSNEGVTTKGTWSNGKLNGKGLIIRHNMKQKCVWRFGRLVNSVLSLNKKIKINERVFDFLAAEDLMQIAYQFKTKSMLGFLEKDNCENLLKLKVLECLSHNVPESNKEIKKFLASPAASSEANLIINAKNHNLNLTNQNRNNSNHINSKFYNKKFFEFLCKDENYLCLFDCIFEHCYDCFIPAVAVKCNGGYPNKIMHYSNAFDPSRSNSYSSNYIKAYGKNVDITGAFISQSDVFKTKVLEKYAKLTSNGNSFDMSKNNYNNKNNKNNNILISLEEEIKNDKAENQTTATEDIQYLCKMAKLYADLKKKILSSKTKKIKKNNDNINKKNNDSAIYDKELMKFLLSINFCKIFKYKKNSYFGDAERKAELDNLTSLQSTYSNILNKYSAYYTYDYNHRVITDTQVYEKLNVYKVASRFCLNKIAIDIPFNVHELNKLSLPAKTIVFFLHNGILTKNELINFQLDSKNGNNQNGFANSDGLNFNPKINEIANDAFLSKYSNCFEDEKQLALLLSEISKINSINTNNNYAKITSSDKLGFNKVDNNKAVELNQIENSKVLNNNSINDNLNILNVTKSIDSLFIEFDTESSAVAKIKLLGICFLKDYDMPNIINLKPFYHFGNLVTARLVNQEVLIPNFKPSAIDVGSITFYGEEFRFE